MQQRLESLGFVLDQLTDVCGKPLEKKLKSVIEFGQTALELYKILTVTKIGQERLQLAIENVNRASEAEREHVAYRNAKIAFQATSIHATSHSYHHCHHYHQFSS